MKTMLKVITHKNWSEIFKTIKTILSNTSYLLLTSKIVFKTGFWFISKFGKFTKLVMQQISHFGN